MDLRLALLEGRLAVCRLPPGSPPPTWAANSPGLCSWTRTRDEWSVVCAEGEVPEGVRAETGWRVFRVEGPLDFGLTGVLLSMAKPLAEAGVAIFALSTYDTDYVLVKEEKLAAAIGALEAAGHRLSR